MYKSYVQTLKQIIYHLTQHKNPTKHPYTNLLTSLCIIFQDQSDRYVCMCLPEQWISRKLHKTELHNACTHSSLGSQRMHYNNIHDLTVALWQCIETTHSWTQYNFRWVGRSKRRTGFRIMLLDSSSVAPNLIMSPLSFITCTGSLSIWESTTRFLHSVSKFVLHLMIDFSVFLTSEQSRMVNALLLIRKLTHGTSSHSLFGIRSL